VRHEAPNHQVFVYGTLKRGHPNYREGMRDAPYLGDFRLSERYPLVLGAPWFTPSLLDEPGQGHNVRGEIFTVDGDHLAFLDHIEMTHHSDGYRRVELGVEALTGGDKSAAWVYIRDRQHLPEILEVLEDHYPVDPRYIIPALRG